MLVGYSLDYFYLSAEKWIAMDAFDERCKKPVKLRLVLGFVGFFWFVFFFFLCRDTIL